MRIFNVLRYFFNEAASNLWVNRLNNFISMAIIVFSLFTFGLFLLTAENLTRLIGKWTENIQINVFLTKDSTRESSATLESMIKLSPVVARYEFITREKALERFRSYYPGMNELTSELDTNPFPPSFEVTVRQEFENQAGVEDFVRKLRSAKNVEDVEFDQEWIDRIHFIIRVVRMIGLFFGSILLLTATFSISNVIKLIVLSRRDEIEIMKLVGATNSFIKGPFLTEGLLQGLLGGIIAVASLYILYTVIMIRIMSLHAPFLSSTQLQFLSYPMIGALVSGGMLVGFLGSMFSLEKLMKA